MRLFMEKESSKKKIFGKRESGGVGLGLGVKIYSGLTYNLNLWIRGHETRFRPTTMGSLMIVRFHSMGEGSNLAKIAGKLMNAARNRVHSFLTREFGL
jgi:hypothetical protein